VSARQQQNDMLLRLIEKIHADSRMKSYGSPRVHAELTLGMGLQVNEKRVARLMREAGIQGLYFRRRSWTTVRDPDAEPCGPGRPAVRRGRAEPVVADRYHRTPD